MAKKEKKAEAAEDSTPVEPGPQPNSRTAIERVQLARHADRPHSLDFIERLFDEWRSYELEGLVGQ